jgi:hypothetical protein
MTQVTNLSKSSIDLKIHSLEESAMGHGAVVCVAACEIQSTDLSKVRIGRLWRV